MMRKQYSKFRFAGVEVISEPIVAITLADLIYIREREYSSCIIIHLAETKIWYACARGRRL
jgi:hypothetical protein